MSDRETMNDREMKKVYSRTKTFRSDMVAGFCPGCMHGTVFKLIGEVLEELGVVDRTACVFGVGCCLVVYLIAPLFDYMLSKVPTKIVLVVAAVLGVAFGADALYSRSNPNMAAGAIEDDVVPASAEEAESVAAAAEAAVSAAEAA